MLAIYPVRVYCKFRSVSTGGICFVTQLAQDCCSKKNKSHLRSTHPDHSKHLGRLNRIKGQVDGVEKMITDRRYCLDIITQVRAIAAAAKALETEVLETHL